MKVWHLWARVNTSYDSYDGFVVIAETETEARRYAQKKIADEKDIDAYFWLNSDCSSCTYLAQTNHAEGIVLASFNAG